MTETWDRIHDAALTRHRDGGAELAQLVINADDEMRALSARFAERERGDKQERDTIDRIIAELERERDEARARVAQLERQRDEDALEARSLDLDWEDG